jgi:hypothetical protein
MLIAKVNECVIAPLCSVITPDGDVTMRVAAVVVAVPSALLNTAR